MADLPSHLLLPLGDAEDIGKIVIGVLFALAWIVAQVVAAASAGKKKREAAERARIAETTRGQQDSTSRTAPQPPPVQPRPASQRQPMPWSPEVPVSYDEMRRRLQQRDSPSQATLAAPKGPKRHPKPRTRREPQSPVVTSSVLFEQEIGAGGGEVGSLKSAGTPGEEMALRSRRDPGSASRLRGLLRGRGARDALVISEILREPVALRPERESQRA